MLKEKVIIDTIDLKLNYEEELEYYDMYEINMEQANMFLQDFICAYETRYRTNILAICFLGSRSSLYGYIGGNGAIVGTASEVITFEDVIGECDNFKIEMTKDNQLCLVKYDHDGTNHMELILLTEKEVNHYYYNEYDYYNLVDYAYQINKSATKLFGEILQV